MEEPSLAVVIAQLKWITQSVHEIKIDIRDLQAFKWKMIGAGTLIGLSLGVILELVKK